uniref:Uncharacterized protein n=1 Tax=Rhizophora mucronata TaxID=61149 RepID=A0A2P2PB40_RHIMU
MQIVFLNKASEPGILISVKSTRNRNVRV